MYVSNCNLLVCVCALRLYLLTPCVCVTANACAYGCVYMRMRALLCRWRVDADDVPDKALPGYDPDIMSSAHVVPSAALQLSPARTSGYSQ